MMCSKPRAPTVSVTTGTPGSFNRVELQFDDGTDVRKELRQALDDDHHLQEGAAQFREQQADYERHTSESPWILAPKRCDCRQGRDPCTCGKGPQPPDLGVFEGFKAAFVVFVLLLAAAVLVVKSCSSAHAQTNPTNLLVRACPTTPAVPGWSACSNSVWAAPSATVVMDVQRNSSDLWLTAAQLANGDHVFACEDATVAPGPFASCPSTLPGQTNNYLLASTINFAPTPASGSFVLSWSPVTTDDESTPVPLTTAQTVAYQLFVRPNNGTSASQYPATPTADTPLLTWTITELQGPYCAEVGAYFTGQPSTIGPLSDEYCFTINAPKITPAKVTGLTGSATP